jgi:hypothetical protein
MACTTCGSSYPCGCRSSSPSSNCPSQGCCTPVPSTPVPYYQCAPVCAEDHTKKITIQQFYTTVKVDNTWNIPACGETAVLSVAGLKSVEPGAYLWASEYGYFEIVSFDAANGEVTVQNNCNEGNAAVGTSVPACTDFIVSDPPCDCTDDSNVCVEIDFTAPDVDDCIDITLTATSGLTAGDTVQIGSGFYFLQEIKPNNIVTICNQGEGITPGTSVIAKDSNGNYQYCLSVISVNPCGRDAVSQGTVLVCAGGDSAVVTPLNGAAEGYVATLVDPDLVTAEYRPLGVTECATTTAALNIITGTLQYNNVAVDDSTIFQSGDIIRIGNRTDRGEINGLPDGTHINFFLVPLPAADETMPIGTVICPIDCCEDLQNQINELSDTLIIDLTTGDVGAISGTFTANASDQTAIQSYTLNNTSSKTMHVTVTTEFNFVADTQDLTGTAQAVFEMRILTNVGAPPVGAVVTHLEDLFVGFSGEGELVRTINHTQTFTIAAATSTTFQFRGFLAYTEIADGMSMDYDASVNMSYLGVAV